MSVVEVLLRFAVVAAVFAVSMVLLRRYGKSRQRMVQEHGGLQVTSRVTLGRGVQLLLVKAGKADFLVSSGGRVAMTPVAAPTVVAATSPDAESGVDYPGQGDVASTPPVATAGDSAHAGEQENKDDAQQLSPNVQEPLVEPSFARGPMGWSQRAGYRLGLWVRARFLRKPQHVEAPSFADVLAQFDEGVSAEDEPEDTASSEVDRTPPAHPAPSRVTFQGPVRADLEADVVAMPAQPVAPSTYAVLTHAVQETTRRRPRRRATKPAAPSGGVSGVPGSRATSGARVAAPSETSTPPKKAPAKARRSPRKASASAPAKKTATTARTKTTPANGGGAASTRSVKKEALAPESAPAPRSTSGSRGSTRTKSAKPTTKASGSAPDRPRTTGKAQSSATSANAEDTVFSAPPRSSVADPLTPAASMVPNLAPSAPVGLSLPAQEVAPA